MKFADNTDLTPAQKFDLQIVGWLSFIGLADLDEFNTDVGPKGYISECSKYSSIRGRKIMEDAGIPLVSRNRVINIIQDALVNHEFISISSKILNDAIYADFLQTAWQ